MLTHQYQVAPRLQSCHTVWALAIQWSRPAPTKATSDLAHPHLEPDLSPGLTSHCSDQYANPLDVSSYRYSCQRSMGFHIWQCRPRISRRTWWASHL